MIMQHKEKCISEWKNILDERPKDGEEVIIWSPSKAISKAHQPEFREEGFVDIFTYQYDMVIHPSEISLFNKKGIRVEDSLFEYDIKYWMPYKRPENPNKLRNQLGTFRKMKPCN